MLIVWVVVDSEEGDSWEGDLWEDLVVFQWVQEVDQEVEDQLLSSIIMEHHLQRRQQQQQHLQDYERNLLESSELMGNNE